MALSDSQLQAVCALLRDGQPAVRAALDRQIAGLAEADRRRLLERLRAEGGDAPPLLPALEGFHRDLLERAFAEWAVSPPGDADLEKGAFLLASFGCPLEAMAPRSAELDGMARSLGERLEGAREPAAAAGRMAEYLGGELGFAGDRENYYDAENSYLNRVLERRRGIPISLSAVYLLVGRRLGLPLRGVGMPGHFIVRYETGGEPIFLDPFEGGRRLSVPACEAVVRGLGYHFDVRFLDGTPDRRIVERMMNNLIGIFQRGGEEEKARRLLRYREIVQRG